MISETQMRNIILQALFETSTNLSKSFESITKMKEKQQRTITTRFGQYCPVSEMIAFLDTTMFGSCKEGYLLGLHGIYSPEFQVMQKDPDRILFDGLTEVLPDKKNHILVRTTAGDQSIFTSIYTDYMLALLQNIIQKMKMEEPVQAALIVQTPKTVAEEVITLEELDIENQLNQAQEAYDRGEQKEAFEIWMKLAEAGNGKAQNNVGVSLRNGEGVPRDYAAAFQWFLKAAQQNYPAAFYNLGLCYSRGRGVAKDVEKAAWYYQLGAEQGHRGSMYNYAGALFYGEGIAKDVRQAATWYQKAAEKGNTNAAAMIAYMYADGVGVKQDYTKALHWYKQAADKNNDSALLGLGILYEYGRGVPKDVDQALLYYRKSAELGNTGAMRNLTAILAQSEEDHLDEALVWAEKVQKLGDPAGEDIVGEVERRIRERDRKNTFLQSYEAPKEDASSKEKRDWKEILSQSGDPGHGPIPVRMMYAEDSEYESVFISLETGDTLYIGKEDVPAILGGYEWFDEYQFQFDGEKLTDPRMVICSNENRTIWSRDIIEFGHYPQGEDGEVSPITWYVLYKDGNDVLLMSEKILDAKPYQRISENFDKDYIAQKGKINLDHWKEAHSAAEWEALTKIKDTGCSFIDSDLCHWLNTAFWDRAFEEAEKQKIVGRPVAPAQKYRGPRGQMGHASEWSEISNVFILSLEEALLYFTGIRNRARELRLTGITAFFLETNQSIGNAYATPYAIRQDRVQNESLNDPVTGRGKYWLRNQGYNGLLKLASKNTDTKTNYFADTSGEMSCNTLGVRPAIWVNISALQND